jgi:hypothetical protein
MTLQEFARICLARPPTGFGGEWRNGYHLLVANYCRDGVWTEVSISVARASNREYPTRAERTKAEKRSLGLARALRDPELCKQLADGTVEEERAVAAGLALGPWLK